VLPDTASAHCQAGDTVFVMRRSSRWFATAAACAAVAVIGWLDYMTGPRWGFSLFYLMPILTVGWIHGRASAVVVATAAGAAWLSADIVWYQDAVPSVWNGVTRLVMYTALGVMAAMLHEDRRQLRAIIEHEREIARTDSLTGLMNSRAFYERLESEIARNRRRHSPIALMYVDVDNFKQVNDRHGHAQGDSLLAAIGAAIQSAVRKADSAARMGGDEFAILLVDIDRSGLEVVAARVIEAADNAVGTHREAGVGVSVGVALFAEPPGDADTLVQAGDEAMYQAKSGGKHRYSVSTF
jgi:diguanylate cyclase (GGDEF)-like protein